MKKTLILLIVVVLFVVSVPFLVFAAGGTSTTFQSGNAVKAANFTGTVNVRTAPGTYSPVVGQHVAGDTGTISNVTGQGQWVAEYSAPGGGYYWWNVTFNSGASGWMVENYLIIDPNPPVPVGNTQPSVVLSANSTSVNPGDSIYFTWSSSNTVSCTASGGWSGALSTSGSKSIIATNASVYPTQTAFIITCLGSNGTNVSQTVRVDISASNLSNLLPTVTLTSSPSSIISGQTSLLSWSTTNAVTCNATGAWTGVMPTSGSVVVSPTQTSSYTIDCNNSLGAIATDSKTVTVSQNTGGGTPTVSLSVSTSAITLGQSATLSWTTSNVTNCTASGGWSGAQTTSGTQVITPNQTTSYSLSCYSTVTGSSASQNVTVNVTQPIGAPSVTLSASQTSVANGQPVTLSWVSTNASSCAAPWTSSVAPSGSQIIYPTFPSSYTIYCTGANNTTVSSNSVAITVGQGNQTPAVSTKFNPGDNVVTANFTGTVNIRTSPGVNSPIVGQHIPGDTGVITNVGGQGQWLADYNAPGGGYYWWNVAFNNGASGWMVENYLSIGNPPLSPGSITVTLSAAPTTISSGQSSTLTWNSSNATGCFPPGGVPAGPSGSVTVSPAQTTTYSIICTDSVTKSSAQSNSVTITVTSVTNPSGSSVSISAGASSNGPFTSKNFSISSGQSYWLNMSSVNTGFCYVGAPVNSGVTLPQTTGPIFPGHPHYPNSGSVTYMITCTTASGTVSDTLTVSVGQTTPPPPPATSTPIGGPTGSSVDIQAGTLTPTKQLSNGPLTLKVGDVLWFSVTGVNVNWCTTLAPLNGVVGNASANPIVWGGITSTNTFHYPAVGGTTYTVTCTTPSGTNVTDSVLVYPPAQSVVTPPPTPTPTPTVPSGNISYTCSTAYGGANQPIIVNPSPYLTNKVTCYPNTGNNVTLPVTTPNPGTTASVNLLANNSNGPVSITSGQTVTLSWSSSNVSSCSASGGWTGVKSTSGALVVTPVGNTSYTISCTSQSTGQPVSDSVTVVIGSSTGNPNTPTGDLKISTDGVTFVDGPITIPAPTNLTSQSIWFNWVASQKPNNCYVITKGGSQYSAIASNLDTYTWGPMNYGIRGYPIPTGTGVTTTVYELYCANGVYNGGPGTFMDSVTLNTASTMKPYLDLRVGYSNSKTLTIANGEVAPLSWTSYPTNMSCVGTGANYNNYPTKWNGLQPAVGNLIEYPYANTVYTLSCVDPSTNQIYTDSVSVTVN